LCVTAGCKLPGSVTGPPGYPGTPQSLQPAASPDGMGCLLAARPGLDTPLLLYRPTLAPEQLARTNWYKLAPDGRSVALVRGFPNTIFLLSLADKVEHQVYAAPVTSPLISYLTWSPDSKQLLFGLTCPGCPASQDAGALWSLEVSSATVRQLAPSGGYSPLFSPDNRFIAVAGPLGTYASHGSLGLWSADGRTSVTLFEFVQVFDRAWADDSSGFMAAVSASGNTDRATGIWWIPIRGNPVRLYELPASSAIIFQPGGKRLVFRSLDDPVRVLYLANRDGSEILPIAGSSGFSPVRSGFPAWSDDGRWLLLVDTNGKYALLDVSNRSLEALPFAVIYGWAAQGRYLAGQVAPGLQKQYDSGEDVPVDVLLCSAPVSCVPLASVSRLANIAYFSP
ncbi:MAG: WD40 repeat domain-containing protein, partial [Anaerolineae bacterium]